MRAWAAGEGGAPAHTAEGVGACLRPRCHTSGLRAMAASMSLTTEASTAFRSVQSTPVRASHPTALPLAPTGIVLQGCATTAMHSAQGLPSSSCVGVSPLPDGMLYASSGPWVSTGAEGVKSSSCAAARADAEECPHCAGSDACPGAAEAL